MDRRAPTGRAWCLYRPKDGEGDELRVYNTTDQDVPLVVSVKGKEYALAVPEWTYEPDYLPKKGDRIFRLLTEAERENISHMAAKTNWRKNGRVGFKAHKKNMHNALRKKLTIFELTTDAQNQAQ